MNFLRAKRALIVFALVVLVFVLFLAFFYVSSAQSVTCDFGTYSSGQCRGYLTYSGITVDSATSSECDSYGSYCGSGPSLTFPVSVGANADFLVVSVSTYSSSNNPTPALTSVTYNGVAMTLGTTTLNFNAGSYDGYSREDLWYLATTSVNSKNVVITAPSTLAGDYHIGAIAASFDGVNTSSPIRGYAAGSNDNTGPASVTISSATNDLVFDFVCDGTSVNSSSQTTLLIPDWNTYYDGCDSVGASTQAGASSVTMSWDVGDGTDADTWIDLAASLEPVPSALAWTVPDDWNSASNTIEAIGGGGGGASDEGYGGGGGEYEKISDFSAATGATISYAVGIGGGTYDNGGDSWFDSTAVLDAKGGQGAGSGGSGGTGSVGYNGGDGGIWLDSASGPGGGGAGGPNGAGGAGGSSDNYADPGGGGGNGGGTAGSSSGPGGNNSSGTGGGTGGANGTDGGGGSGDVYGSGQGGNGGDGEEWDATHGSGGGGGGGSYGIASNNAAGGYGGAYGGGGGAGGYTGVGGNGAQGIIVITYTPVESGGAAGRIIRLLGGIRLIGGVRLE